MRDNIAMVVTVLGCVLALVAVGWWMHFVWSFDWGHFGSRNWGFAFFVAFLFGSVVIGVALVAFFIWLGSLIEGAD